jgi:VWFA-related protein
LTIRAFTNHAATRLLPQAVPYQAIPYQTLLYRTLRFAILCLALLSLNVSGQTPTPTKPPQPDDVVRVNTELVQTGVMVFDKQGHFVEGLRREQFELSVDGKPQPVSFFEQVKAGSSKERAQLASIANPAAAETVTAINDTRGRTIVFFIDDLHLSLDSLGRTRKTLAQFIDHEMGDDDRVAIASTSGDIGFLQQFTDNQSVLHAAAGRLIQHPYNVRDMTDVTTPMTEYMALTIERKDDPGVLEFYIDECLRAAYPLKYRRASCELQVKSRARLILLQAASVTLNTYAALESLMRSSAQMSGRKLVFFISDGFLLDTGPRNADPRGKLKEITDAALRGGVVIYTIDAKGLFSGQLDATNNVPFDKQNRIENAILREGPASQDALNALAGDTGGRALRNQNYFDKWVNKVLDETSNYYLLAWRPNKEEEEIVTHFKNITARVIDHPEFTVRLPRGFLRSVAAAGVKPTATVQIQAPSQPNSHQDLQQALTALYPKHEISLALSAIFLDTPDHGPVLTASVQVANDLLAYEGVEGKQVAAVDVVGVVVNDRGKQAGTFQTRLKINATASTGTGQDNSATIYNYRVPIKPGLYQVRIATRDNKNGRVGSAQQWIEIPDLSLRRLSLSSLLLGLQNVGGTKDNAGGAQVQFSTDHRFARNSHLSFMTFIYNAARGPDGKSPPNIWLQARLLRGGQTVRTTPMKSVPIASQDFVRIPFVGEIALDSIPSGAYILEIVVDDQLAKTTVSQRTKITVE